MVAEGERGIRRDARSRKLAVVVAVQNVLVAACLVVTAYVYWTVADIMKEKEVQRDVHLQFDVVPGIFANETLKMYQVLSGYKMSVADNGSISVNCSGSYVMYLHVCYKSMSKSGGSAVLQLRERGSEAPLSIFNLRDSTSLDDCRGLPRLTYLRAKQEVSLQLFVTGGFKMINMTVDLSYLQGGRCET